MYAVCVLILYGLNENDELVTLPRCSKTSKRQHMYAVCVLPAHLLKKKACSPAQKPASASTCMLCVLMLYGLNENDIYNQLGILNQLGRRESLSGAVENAKPVSPPRT